MIRKISTVLLAALFTASFAYGQRISDVSKQDPSFSAISKVVKQGYLSLNDKDQFDAQSPVNRKELALILDKLTSDTDQTSAGLTRIDTQEIKSSIKIFKQYFSDYESTLTKNATVMTRLANEQKVINTDLTKINDELNAQIQDMKKENELQRQYMWYGIISAALLGMIIH